jgi:hypothetical protein
MVGEDTHVTRDGGDVDLSDARCGVEGLDRSAMLLQWVFPASAIHILIRLLNHRQKMDLPLPSPPVRLPDGPPSNTLAVAFKFRAALSAGVVSPPRFPSSAPLPRLQLLIPLPSHTICPIRYAQADTRGEDGTYLMRQDQRQGQLALGNVGVSPPGDDLAGKSSKSSGKT